MSDFKFFVVLILMLTISFSMCNAATLPSNGNTTSDSTALMAKSSTGINDVFEDVQWFFTRLGIFCDLVEQMLPPEKRSGDQTQLNVGLTLQGGFRHFLLGVREISKSITAVLSNKEIQEYKQLSRATDYAQEMVKSTGHFFRNLRKVIAHLFDTYNFYVPEIMLTKCVGIYMHTSYSHRPFYEYPILFINDIIEAFQKPLVDLQIDGVNTATNRKMGKADDMSFDKSVEQNEILDDEMYLFHNTPISPSPELAADTALDNNKPAEDDEELALKEPSVHEILSWKKCFKLYATETIFRKLEFYFLETRA